MIGRIKRALRRVLRDEDGQGLVEFAIVLPILLLLTLGTIMLTLSYIQKARMNGLAYMSARVAAVRRPNFDAATYTLRQYKERSGQTWTDEVRVSAPALGENQVGFRLQKSGERLDLLANLISGQPGQEPRDLIVEMQLPREYPPSGALRPATHTEVDYRYAGRGLGAVLDALPGPLKALLDTTQMADTKSSSLGDRDQDLSLRPRNENLKKLYQQELKWEKAFSDNQEAPTGDFAAMVELHENFKKLEAGAVLLSILKQLLSSFAGPVLGAIQSGGAELAVRFEQGAHTLGQKLDENVRSSVAGGGS